MQGKLEALSSQAQSLGAAKADLGAQVEAAASAAAELLQRLGVAEEARAAAEAAAAGAVAAAGHAEQDLAARDQEVGGPGPFSRLVLWGWPVGPWEWAGSQGRGVVMAAPACLSRAAPSDGTSRALQSPAIACASVRSLQLAELRAELGRLRAASEASGAQQAEREAEVEQLQQQVEQLEVSLQRLQQVGG